MSKKQDIALLIMANMTDQRLLSAFLEKLGFQVNTSTTTITEKEWLMSSIIILDEICAKRFGSHLLKIKRESGPIFVPMVILLPSKRDNLPWLQLGFDEVLRLPLRKAELIAKINMLMRLRVQSEIQYRLIFENINIGIYRISADKRISFANKCFAQTIGYQSADKVINMTFKELGVARQSTRKKIITAMEGIGESVSYESIWKRRDGRKIHVIENDIIFKINSNDSYYYASTIEDITARTHAEKQIKHMAYHDPLTGLVNRTKLEMALRLAILSARRGLKHVAVIYLDLDHFKSINDSLGHFKGDIILREVACRLKNATRNTDTVSRVGGDEFIIVLADIYDTTEIITSIVNKIKAALTEPIVVVDLRKLYVTASMGISIYPTDGTDATTLIKNADVAMYVAKKGGERKFKFCTPEMTQRAEEKTALEEKLRNALSNHEFEVYYQPKLDILSEKISGIEALLRWNKEQVILLPSTFIPLSEEMGLIVPMTEMLFTTVCQQMQTWQNENQPPLNIAINLSGNSFVDHHFISTITRILKTYNIAPSNITLEITESVLIKDIESSAQTMKKIKEMGMKISIDDFGTGYSSLNYLKYFVMDSLKIDISFVRDIAIDPNDALIVSAIIAMAHSLKITVIAEGVETKAQFDFLKQHGCDEIQGFYFCKPLSANDLMPFIQLQQ